LRKPQDLINSNTDNYDLLYYKFKMESKKQTRFIKQPFITDLEDKGLKYTDLFTLYALLSFRNNKSKLCYPSTRTLADTMKIARQSVITSIERLAASGIVEVQSGNREVSNHYKFNIDEDKFKMLPYDLLNNDELTINEKSILIAIRQYCLDETTDSILMKTQIAKNIGIGYSAFRKQFNHLKEKGYVEEAVAYGKGGTEKFQIRMNAEKVNWQLKVLTARMDEVEVKVEANADEVAELKARLAKMEAIVAKMNIV